MANEEHLALLRQGISVWNEWRRNNPKISPDVSGANLENMYLESANFKGANLAGANLTKSVLRWARFDGATLNDVVLDGADVVGTTLATMLRQQKLEKERQERLGKQRQKTLEAHKQFLKSRNFECHGVQVATARQHRVTRNCRGNLDNSVDLEGSACGWILCRCGACGCGYRR